MAQAYTAAEAAAWCDGEVVQGAPDTRFAATSIDTRTLGAGALFVAIAGPNHDAHGFLDQAADAGAAGLLVERARIAPGALPAGACVIACDDTTRALGAVASGHRARFAGPLVGITGSSGKTTTKEMTAAVFAAHGPCLKTEGNLNNEFGLPLTLLRREAEHASAVIELGMNHRGEIAALAAIARPDVALITNIGTAHIEHLGSREAIADEKGDLFAALTADGIAAVNADDARIVDQARRVAGRTLRYAVHADADVRARGPRFASRGAWAFALETPAGTRAVEVPGLSETTVINALAATAAGVAAELPLDTIVRGLCEHEPARGRMTRHALAREITLIDDTYNANPASMRASLESLAELRGSGRAIAVLGTMGELGETADAAHHEMGALAAELRLDALYALGEGAPRFAAGARAGGMQPSAIHEARSHAEIVDALRERAAKGDWILVKGSRAMRMERIVEALLAAEQA